MISLTVRFFVTFTKSSDSFRLLLKIETKDRTLTKIVQLC